MLKNPRKYCRKPFYPIRYFMGDTDRRIPACIIFSFRAPFECLVNHYDAAEKFGQRDDPQPRQTGNPPVLSCPSSEYQRKVQDGLPYQHNADRQQYGNQNLHNFGGAR